MNQGARLPPKLLWIVVGCMVCQMGAGLFHATRALAPDLIADLGWTRTMWSSAMLPMLFVSSICQAFVGAACVRFGVRPVVVTSVAFLVVSLVVLSTVQDPWIFYLATVLLAIGNAGIGDVSIGAVITRWFDRARGLALGFAFVGSNLGAVIFVHAIAAVTTVASWREAALGLGIAGGALIMPFAFFVVRDPRPGEGASQRDEPAEVEGRASGGDAASIPLSRAIRGPAFWIFFHTIFCYAIVQLGLYDHLILYLGDIGYSRTEAAGALELAMGAGIIAKLGAGAIALRLTAKTALLINTWALTASLALMPFAGDPRMLALFGLVFGISTAARDVLVPLFVAEVFGAKYFPQIFGALMVAFFPGGGLGPIILARAHDVLGTYRPGFMACLLMTATAAIALGFVGRRRAPLPVI
ncbi:MAG: MFS transporter [Deltaproteobacteria bacterium]|jgi:predicted MFS family arabinose efflux permease|nr:MFS transporter [Deltaproteobacteria bacterium]MBW2498524.1 MFS transporter [Deltaproteobacteria bacterium]